jgi:hypothetical protein
MSMNTGEPKPKICGRSPLEADIACQLERGHTRNHRHERNDFIAEWPRDAHDNVCSRCGEPCGSSWEARMAAGRIELGASCQAFAKLARAKGWSAEQHSNASEWGDNPSGPMAVNEAQRVVFEWGDGVALLRSARAYRLCEACQGKLLGLVGEFFGVPDGSR